MERRVWFDRAFELGLPLESLPDLVERLRGTPLRLRERVSRALPEVATTRIDGAWSILEHAGHMADLEPLWLGRMEDFLAGAETLRPADLENRATWDAGHNQRAVEEILEEFAARRTKLLALIESMSDEERARTALHPRLEQPMNVADLSFFVAEHDDHHLAAITELIDRVAE